MAALEQSYVQLRFSRYHRGRWLTLACEAEPQTARRRAAALYQGARTACGDHPIAVRVVTGGQIPPEQRHVEVDELAFAV
jgi:hypothetical protein